MSGPARRRLGVFPWQGLGALLAALLALALLPRATWSQEPIRVHAAEIEVRFAERVVFRAEAEADQPIRRAEVLYRKVGERVRARATAEFTPGTSIRATYTWELEPGELPPGAQVEYVWRLEDEAGHVLTTPAQVFTYLDDRFDWKDVSAGQVTLHYYHPREAQAEELLGAAL
ncbi:MAG: hypothetical protein H5T59_11690, partial [Anaerolineae bacterium]|nr:hypothetical protein [Anaerolineae bacterium]